MSDKPEAGECTCITANDVDCPLHGYGEEPCTQCLGAGMVEIIVSENMAIDAGDRSMAGFRIREACPNCGGSGHGDT